MGRSTGWVSLWGKGHLTHFSGVMTTTSTKTSKRTPRPGIGSPDRRQSRQGLPGSLRLALPGYGVSGKIVNGLPAGERITRK